MAERQTASQAIILSTTEDTIKHRLTLTRSEEGMDDEQVLCLSQEQQPRAQNPLNKSWRVLDASLWVWYCFRWRPQVDGKTMSTTILYVIYLATRRAAGADNYVLRIKLANFSLTLGLFVIPRSSQQPVRCWINGRREVFVVIARYVSKLISPVSRLRWI